MSEASHFRGFDFTGTDWAEANRVIAARLGAEENLVAAARKHFGMVVRVRVDWSDNIDWNLSNKELAKMYNVRESTVSRQRAFAGMGFGQIDWDSVDWSKLDREIAREVGCTAAAVGKARRRITGLSSRQRGRPKRKEGAERPPTVTLKNLSPEAVQKFRQHAEASGVSLDDAVCKAVARYLKWLEE